jgi:hypothetical protein
LLNISEATGAVKETPLLGSKNMWEVMKSYEIPYLTGILNRIHQTKF